MAPSIAFFRDPYTESAVEDVGMISLDGCSGKRGQGTSGLGNSNHMTYT